MPKNRRNGRADGWLVHCLGGLAGFQGDRVGGPGTMTS